MQNNLCELTLFLRTIMKIMRFYIYCLSIFSIAAVAIGASGCKKPLSFSSGNLDFSADTVVFDTVFTTVGSTTKKLKIYNNDTKTLNVESIELVGGANSPFRINVDGLSGTNFSNLEIEGKDSLFIFVEVTLDPNNVTNPLVIEDQIRFRTNGQDQYVELVAWGQDAYFHYSLISQGIFDLNEGTWPNDKPHVIYGAAFVDEGKTLNIQEGTDIYLHKGSFLFNFKGTLHINGTKDNPVTLQGDRLEALYDDVAGQYYGIYFQEARPSTIDYAVIKNGTTGIHVESTDPGSSGYTVTVNNTRIENNASYGVLLFQGARMKAENSIISHSGIHGLTVIGGADFDFNHCNILGYGNGQSVAAAAGISNWYYNPELEQTEVGDLDGRIRNSVIYGNLDYELAIDTVVLAGATIDLDFQRNLIRSEEIFTNGFSNGNLWNLEPYFYNTSERDFHIWSASGMNGVADPAFPTLPNLDIDQIARGPNPDMGAHEN